MKLLANIARKLPTDAWIGALFFAAALALYLRTMPPTILDSDSGEYQYMAYILGVSHSTGYPLYLLLAKLFTFLPIGDVAFRVNLSSTIFTALAAPVVFWTARRLQVSRTSAILATLILLVTPSIWGGVIDTKSYALHVFLGVLTLYLALRWHQEGKPTDFYWLAFVYGLGLTNHIMIRFIAPALLLLLWFNRTRLNRAMLLRGALFVLVPLLLYAYIPIRANQLIAQQDPQNLLLYGRSDAMLKGTVTAYYNNTLDGFVKFVTGFDNVYKLEVKSPLESTNRLDLSLTLLWQQFGFGIALALVGAWQSWRRDRRVFLFLFAFAAGVGAVAFYLHGISTVYYFSLTYLVLALWIGSGIDALMRWTARVRAAAAVIPLVLLLLPLYTLAANFPKLDESSNYTYRQYAEQLIGEDFPPNAVLAAPWEISQPLRYLQFVENRRPDLLVINLSPVGMSERQFNTILANAKNLNRPFYLVEFRPELKTDPGPRTLQAIPLPMLAAPQPQYALKNASILPEVQVIGYDFDPDPPQPGNLTRVWVYYRATARIYPMYHAVLRLADITGRPWGDYDQFPVSEDFPTYRWYELGEYYRDGWTINLPADAPDGLYNLEMLWYPYNVDTQKLEYEHEYQVALGTIRVGSKATTPIERAQNVRVGDAITFLGSSGAASSVTRGQTLNLDLFWRADRTLAESYTVFVHLVDASGNVVRDADSPPSSGAYPTDRWDSGETVRDRHALVIPAGLSPGDYTLEIGIYLPSTGARLPVGNTDKIVLTHIKVQ